MRWASFTQPAGHWCDPPTKRVRNTRHPVQFEHAQVVDSPIDSNDIQDYYYYLFYNSSLGNELNVTHSTNGATADSLIRVNSYISNMENIYFLTYTSWHLNMQMVWDAFATTTN